jgi:hypothetical protein
MGFMIKKVKEILDSEFTIVHKVVDENGELKIKEYEVPVKQLKEINVETLSKGFIEAAYKIKKFFIETLDELIKKRN